MNLLHRIRAASNKGGVMLISGIVSAIPFVFQKLFFLTLIGLIPFAIFCLTENGSGRTFRKNALLFAFGYHFPGCIWFRSLYPDKFAYIGIEGIGAFSILIVILVGLPLLLGLLMMLVASVCRYLSRGLSSNVRVFVFPAVFVLTEYLETLGPFAFPWCRLALTQTALPFLIQTSSLFGAGFVSFVVALLAALIASAIVYKEKRKSKLFGCVMIVCAVLLFGFIRIAVVEHGYTDDNAFNASALQGNVAIKIKNAPNVAEIHASYDALANDAASAVDNNFSTLMAAPETAAQINIFPGDELYTHLSALSTELDVNLAVGAFSFKDGEDGNAVFFFTPDGGTYDPYVKRNRVPFGEYLPFRPVISKLLPFVNNIIGMDEEQYAGEDSAIVETSCGKVGTLICFESIFPQTALKSIRDGAEILIVCTNDAWFDSSEELHQHTSHAILRAVENGVPLINAANTGTSALIEPTGKTVKLLAAHETGYINAVLHKSGRTVYSYIGDLFVYAVMAALIVCFIASVVKKKRRASDK